MTNILLRRIYLGIKPEASVSSFALLPEGTSEELHASNLSGAGPGNEWDLAKASAGDENSRLRWLLHSGWRLSLVLATFRGLREAQVKERLAKGL